MHEDTDTMPCDFEDCTEDGTQAMLVGTEPVAVLCDTHQEEALSKQETHSIALDVHFHKHVIVSLVPKDMAPETKRKSSANGVAKEIIH